MAYNAAAAGIIIIPPYCFFSVIGAGFAATAFILLLMKYDCDIRRYARAFLYSGIGLLFGAKAFGCFAGLYNALANDKAPSIDAFLDAGIVYYGGLFGFIISFMLLCEKWDGKIDWMIMDMLSACIPLFHVFGRLGCFFGGCCYGIESESRFAMLYTPHADYGIGAAVRFPVQLAEAAGNAVLFALLCGLLKAEKLRGQLLWVYLILYGAMRFVLEFWRGDAVRGVWNGISFSQVVGMAVIVFATARIYKAYKPAKRFKLPRLDA